MRRLHIDKRSNWQKRVQERGLIFDFDDTYWAEGSCYQFTSAEIDTLESAANAVHQLCLQAIDYLISNNHFQQFHIPEHIIPLIKESWQKKEPSFYGRFDFAFDGKSEPKLLEYNADTPTSLLEASVLQWDWLQQLKSDQDQFNSLHEAMIARWKFLELNNIHFSCLSEQAEDFITTEYLRETAIQAGLKTEFLDISHIGYDFNKKDFVDLQENQIKNLFKLYPWEWLIQEDFSIYLETTRTTFIEPIWKMLISNKAILPILWELAPDHPNLLPAYFCDDSSIKSKTSIIRKPIWGREGQNIVLTHNGIEYQTSGSYAQDPVIYQDYFQLPNLNGNYPVCGLWMIGHECCGLSIRESSQLITSNDARFVPHFF